MVGDGHPGRCGIGRLEHLEVGALQGETHHFANGRLVVHDEDPLVHISAR